MRRRHAFTLIELLVVIAIIGLLLAILLPSLNKVKEKAREVICRTHLRGIGFAIALYLEDSDGRAFDSTRANRHYWYDAANPGQLIDVRNPSREYYWGLAYLNYAEEPKVFGCPSYARVFDMLYDAGDVNLAPYAGYGLNAFFFREAEMVLNNQTGPGRNNRKVTAIKAPHQFIVTQDHVEPRIEGWSDGGEQNDEMYIPRNQTYNVASYRPGGGRVDYYWGLFRHSKRLKGGDTREEHQKRLTTMDSYPNGNNNALCLDGHVESIAETTGKNIRESRYSGISRIR